MYNSCTVYRIPTPARPWAAPWGASTAWTTRSSSAASRASSARKCSRIGRGDDTVGNPHRAQISQFELFEVKFISRAFRVCPLVEIRQTAPCQAIRGKSSDSRQQYLSQQYPPPLLEELGVAKHPNNKQ